MEEVGQISTLTEIKGIHKGQQAFVFGSGYSLDDFDKTKLTKEHILFSCNQSITALNYSDYFCMSDGATPEANFFDYGVSISKKIAFFGKTFRSLPAVVEHYDIIKDKALFFNRQDDNPDNFNFDLDTTRLIVGTDVVHVAVHLAYITGCSPIVLVGVDLNYKNYKKYCDSPYFKDEIKWSYPETRIFASTFGESIDGEDDPLLAHSFNTWIKIKNANKNIIFLNANPTGKLSELFELFKW